VVVAAAGLLAGGGGVAFATVASSGPVDGSGVIHGCYADSAFKGSHMFVLQDAGTNCPRGTTAVSWNEQGPPGVSYGVSAYSSTEVPMSSTPETDVPVMSSQAVPESGDYYVVATVNAWIDSGDEAGCYVVGQAGNYAPSVTASASGFQVLTVVADVDLTAGSDVTVDCVDSNGDINTYASQGWLTATLISNDNGGAGAAPSATTHKPSAKVLTTAGRPATHNRRAKR
jgi:hypothetical protein